MKLPNKISHVTVAASDIIISMNFIKNYTFVDTVFYSVIFRIIYLKYRKTQAEHIHSTLTLKWTGLDTGWLFAGYNATKITSR